MNILFAASEVAPFAKTGGLADVAGSLPQAIAGLGHDVRVVLPRYASADPHRFGLRHIATFYVPLAAWKERCDLLAGALGPHVTAYFIQKDIYFDRPELYRTTRGDYYDNAERFSFFSRTVPELCRVLGFSPDIVHCSDWQTGLVPLYLKKFYASDPALARARSVFTVHNLGYQGVFWGGDLRFTGLGAEDFTPDGVEFWGNLNFLKAGILFADEVTTVSRTYSRDIRTPEGGHGLDGVLRRRAAHLHGIVNGIDYDEWDPAKDPAIAQQYSAEKLSGKRACRTALLQELGLPDPGGPLVGMVSRLTEQKGLDILLDALPAVLALGTGLVILGSGDDYYHHRLRELEHVYRGRMRAVLRYDDALARRIYAGCDLFLMPSRYEPCGLGQMCALRYGSVPVVRRTGGLADTVAAYDPRTGRGTGFVFDDYSPSAVVGCLKKAVALYHLPAPWRRLVRTGMKVDLSWGRSAAEYLNVYRKAMGT